MTRPTHHTQAPRAAFPQVSTLACYRNVSAHQLRGMAIEPDRQGEGIGAHLLAAGIERCAAAGSELVWAHARSTALDFYVRHGFTVSGDEYIEPATGLAHVDVVRAVGPT